MEIRVTTPAADPAIRTTANETTGSVSTARPAHAPMTALLTTPTMPAVVSMSCHVLGPSLFVVQEALGAWPVNHQEKRLEFRREPQVEGAQTSDPLRKCDVFDGGCTRRWNVTAPMNASTGNKISANA